MLNESEANTKNLSFSELNAGEKAALIHGIFSGKALERLETAPIVECVVTDAIPCAMANVPGSKIKQISVAQELSEAIYNVYANKSVSGVSGGPADM